MPTMHPTTMTCGTDFSDGARRAAVVAAALAVRLGARLQRVHAVDDLGAELTFAEGDLSAYEPRRQTLEADAAELRRAYPVSIDTIFVAGVAREHLVDTARHAQSALLNGCRRGRRGHQQRAGLARAWQGSVSRHVLHAADGDVVTVPASSRRMTSVSRHERVLVATDFSDLANRATGVAHGLVPRDVVHLAHVTGASDDTGARSARERLAALVPTDASARGVVTVLEVVDATDVADLSRRARWQRRQAGGLCAALASTMWTCMPGSIERCDQPACAAHAGDAPFGLPPPDLPGRAHHRSPGRPHARGPERDRPRDGPERRPTAIR